MRKRLLEQLFFIISILLFVDCLSNQEPLGVHILYGAQSNNEVNIIWWTRSKTPSALIYYSLLEKENDELSIDSSYCSNDKVAKGYLAKNSTNGKFIQRVYLRNLKPNSKYCYEITSGQASSHIYFFRTAANSIEFENKKKVNSKFLVYGSNNLPDSEQINSLKSKVYQEQINGFINLPSTILKEYVESKNDKNRDFLDYFSDILSNVQLIPTVTQSGDNISNSLFQKMLPLKGTVPFNSYFYSLDINGVHFISYSAEFFETKIDNFSQLENQIKMIKDDLIRAQDNRHLVPWIVVLVSYSSKTNTFIKEKIDRIFYQYNVDVILQSSAAIYDRTYPVIKASNSFQKSYENSRMPIHISLPRYSIDKKIEETSRWSAFHCRPNVDKSFGLLEIMNSSYLKWTYMYNNQSVIDELILFKVHKTNSASEVNIKNKEDINYNNYCIFILLVVISTTLSFIGCKLKKKLNLERMQKLNTNYKNLIENEFEI